MTARLWSLSIAGAALLAAIALPLASQERAITRHNGAATISINDPRPLAQAIIALRQEYGWAVDYEEPPWEGASELRDLSSAAWHASHPGARGFVVPSGGKFQSTYTEAPDMWSSASGELAVLEKVVSDYNASGNPGRFAVREQADGSYAVVPVSAENGNGNVISVHPYLDTVISIPSGTRSADTTMDLILSATSATTGIVGRQGGLGSFNLMRQSMVTLGGTNEPARDFLLQLAGAMRRKMVWDLWYLPDLQKYALHFHPVKLAVPGAFSQKQLVPVGAAQAP